MIKSIVRAFEDHPASVGESYWQHFGAAARYGFLLSKAAGAAFIHAILPFLCERTASNTIMTLHREMSVRFNTPAEQPSRARPVQHLSRT